MSERWRGSITYDDVLLNIMVILYISTIYLWLRTCIRMYTMIPPLDQHTMFDQNSKFNMNFFLIIITVTILNCGLGLNIEGFASS